MPLSAQSKGLLKPRDKHLMSPPMNTGVISSVTKCIDTPDPHICCLTCAVRAIMVMPATYSPLKLPPFANTYCIPKGAEMVNATIKTLKRQG